MKKLLTPLELKVMNILWKIERGFVKDIRDNWDEKPVPAYNTISTIVRILKDKKEYIGHKAFGRTHEYFPVVSKEEYQKNFLKSAVNNVFSGSLTSLVSTLVDKDNVSNQELEELKSLLGKFEK
ncbi:MAG: BlaI/MecI/CopY family transcriptional regulator [Saprospiraceae bacterium]